MNQNLLFSSLIVLLGHGKCDQENAVDKRRHFFRDIVEKIDHEKLVQVDTYKDRDMIPAPKDKKEPEVGKKLQ